MKNGNSKSTCAHSDARRLVSISSSSRTLSMCSSGPQALSASTKRLICVPLNCLGKSTVRLADAIVCCSACALSRIRIGYRRLRTPTRSISILRSSDSFCVSLRCSSSFGNIVYWLSVERSRGKSRPAYIASVAPQNAREALFLARFWKIKIVVQSATLLAHQRGVNNQRGNRAEVA